MKFGIALLSIIPVRKEDDERSEMKSQLLFGEHYKILNIKSGWALIETCFDNYRGWIDEAMITEIKPETYKLLSLGKSVVINRKIVHLILEDKSIQQIVAGSTIPFFKKTSDLFTVEGRTFRMAEEPNPPGIISIRREISDTSLLYLNSPYLWGGRTPFGIDCSGFTQIVYKICGIKLPRDAKQQSECGKIVRKLKEYETGDLAFFRKGQANEISHTGILLDNNMIIHSSGKARIDRIDEKGIFNDEIKSYSHQLVTIQNVIDQ